GDDAGRAAALAAHRDDGARHRGRHAAAGVWDRRGFADAAAAGHRRHRRNYDLNGALAGDYAYDLLPSNKEGPVESIARRKSHAAISSAAAGHGAGSGVRAEHAI